MLIDFRPGSGQQIALIHHKTIIFRESNPITVESLCSDWSQKMETGKKKKVFSNSRRSFQHFNNEGGWPNNVMSFSNYCQCNPWADPCYCQSDTFTWHTSTSRKKCKLINFIFGRIWIAGSMLSAVPTKQISGKNLPEIHLLMLSSYFLRKIVTLTCLSIWFLPLCPLNFPLVSSLVPGLVNLNRRSAVVPNNETPRMFPASTFAQLKHR